MKKSISSQDVAWEAARALKTGKSMTIGVVTRRNVSEDRFTWVLKGIKEVLSMNKYSILLCSDSLNDKGYPEYYSHYHEPRIDGVLFVSHIESMDMKQVEQTAETIQKEQIPAVFIDYHIDNPMVNCVDFNYSHGGYLAARHLIEQGHQRIAYLDPGTGSVQENGRIQGVRKAFLESGLDMNRLKVIKLGESQLAVISLAGSSFTEFCYPRLSASELPLYETGRKSAEVLIEVIKNRALPVNIKLPCTLQVRDSS